MSSSNCLVRLHFPLAVATVVGFLDFRRGSPELKSFLLKIWIDAPESTTNFRFSGFFEEGACRHYPCFGRRVERSLVLVSEIVDIFPKSQASLRAHLSCCKVSSCVPSSWIAFLRFTLLHNSLRWTPFLAMTSRTVNIGDVSIAKYLVAEVWCDRMTVVMRR